jgi:beta-glucosidase
MSSDNPVSLDVDQLIAQLTVEEKAALCLGSDFWHTAGVDRLGIPRIMVSDGPHGLRAQLDEEHQAGLAGSVQSTCFPTACALGSSWDTALFDEVGQAIAREARKWGVAVVLGPGINIKRSPLCGRNFEYISEDPWLAGELAAGMVRGMQALGIGTAVKHYAANNQETDRARVSVDVDERVLREIYLAAFERVVKTTQPWTLMASYNKINGTYATEHHWLLTEVLRDEWGFDGLVMSDWGAVHDRVAALAAGLDLEMPPNRGVSDAAIVAAVGRGALPTEVLDTAVARVLRLAEKSLPTEFGTDFSEAEHHVLARRAAGASAVLLKNDGGVLPLQSSPGRVVAVIGEFARVPRFQGAGSSQVTATKIDIPLDEIVVGLGAGADVRFAAGFGLDSGADDAALSAEAVALARGADDVLLFLGLPGSEESEGFDRSHMDLPANQVALAEALSAVHDRVVVVLANGSAVRLSPWQDRVSAVLECWLSGQAAGGAIADILLGVTNPSGKLAETIPLRLEDNPSHLSFPGDSGHVRYGEGIFVGYRGYDRAHREVSYPFGHGLSYTTFTIDEVQVAVAGSVESGDLAVTVEATVTNTGAVAGAEVVQVYVSDVEASVARPDRELKAFKKVALEPGESRRVSLPLDERSFAYWSVWLNRWAVEAGEFVIAVGTSSRDIAVTATITLDAPRVAAPLGTMSTLEEWIADEDGRALLGKRMAIGDDLLAVIGSMPMETLAGFGMGFDHKELADLVARYNAMREPAN